MDEWTREAWLEWRRCGVGASEVAAVCGLSPWDSPLSVYLRKRGELADDEAPTQAMRLGLALEDTVADEFHLLTGLHVVGAQTWCVHPELPWARATVDGFVVESPQGTRDDALGVFEAKTVGDLARYDPMPEHVAAQVQWQLFVTGLAHGWVAVLGGGYRMAVQVLEVERDEDRLASMVRTASAFWQGVLDGHPPAVTYRDDDVLAAAYPVPEVGAGVELGDEGAELIEELRALRDVARVNEQRLTTTENAIKALLGTNEVGLVDGEAVVTWRAVEMPRVDTQRLRAEAPDVAAQFLTTTTFRRFLVK